MRPIELTPNVRPWALGGWAAAQSAGMYSYFRFFEANGYLPAPFVYDKADTFMDFFNTLYWATNPGRYSDWLSVYPPLNFLFLQAVDLLLGRQSGNDGFDLRAGGGAFILFLVASYLTLPALMLLAKCWTGWTSLEKALIYVITVTATPMLFALERGNLIIFALPLLAWLVSARGASQAIAFAILVNCKPYFALLGGAFLNKPMNAVRCGLFTALLFGVTGLALDEHFLQMLTNLVGFSRSETLFSLREVMSLPSSIGAFTAVLRGVDESRRFLGSGLTFGEVASLLDLARLGIVVISIWTLVRISVDQSTKLVLGIMLIPNLGVWTGGYSLIFLFPLLPSLIRLRSKRICVALVVACMLPLDVITILTDDIGDMPVFLSGQTVGITWTLGLGSILRPGLALLMLCVVLWDIAVARSAPREQVMRLGELEAHVA